MATKNTTQARKIVRRHALDAMARVKLRQYAKTRKGRAVLAGNHMAYAITENAAMGAEGTMQVCMTAENTLAAEVASMSYAMADAMLQARGE